MRSRREQWVERVEQWRRSGLSAKRFAESIGVKAGTLTHWAWQLGREERKRLRSDKAAVELIEIVGRNTAEDCFELIATNGWRLRIAPSFDAAALRKLLEVLEANP